MAQRIGIVGALPEELRPVVGRLRLTRGLRSARGTWAGVEVRLVLGGVGLRAAGAAAEALVAEGCDRLLSIGFAGALADDLAVADVLAVTRVLTADGEPLVATWPVPGRRGGDCLSLPGPTGSAAAKADLRARTGASLVDMETAAVAAVARAHSLPWAGLRAVSDTARDTLPALVLASIRPDLGRVTAARLLATALVSPWTWLPLLRLGVRSARAGQALATAVAATLESVT